MSTPHLKLLYPLIGPSRTSVRQRPLSAIARTNAGDGIRPWLPRAQFSTAVARGEEARQQRYGTAKEPPAHIVAARVPEKGKKSEAEEVGEIKKADGFKKAERILERVADGKKAAEPTTSTVGDAKSSSAASATLDGAKESKASPQQSQPIEHEADGDNATQAEGSKESKRLPENFDLLPVNALQTVLRMPAPGSEQSYDDKPPHLQTPPYVHHFDTWGLVQRLETSGFSDAQSTSLMKAVRGLLSTNMDLARNGLVSRSNVENETYLFKAACSELKTEIQNTRRLESEKLRAQRAQLQHEVDILSQRIGQEGQGLKDELKGMFDDRKMAVRTEERNMESKTQELNYKIQVVLNSDARSEVESTRWELTRRAAAALAATVLMVLGAINYSRYMSSHQEKERKRHLKDMETEKVNFNPVATHSDFRDDQPASSPPAVGSGEAIIAAEGVSLG